MHGWDGFGMGGMMFFWIVLLLVIVAVVIWALARAASPPQAGAGPGAEEIAKQRYARGEITREQYQQIVDDLRRQ